MAADYRLSPLAVAIRAANLPIFSADRRVSGWIVQNGSDGTAAGGRIETQWLEWREVDDAAVSALIVGREANRAAAALSTIAGFETAYPYNGRVIF